MNIDIKYIGVYCIVANHSFCDMSNDIVLFISWFDRGTNGDSQNISNPTNK